MKVLSCFDGMSCGQIAFERAGIPIEKYYASENEYRLFSPIEAERLQTVKDGYTNFVSKGRRYEMLGNGWTVDVIAHIFSYIQTKKP